MPISNTVREFELVDSNLPRDAQPIVFSYAGLWQHDTPLLDMLEQLYGERALDSLGGSYGWSVRYRQIEDYTAIGIHTLREYLRAFRAGNIRLPYLRHLSVNRALTALRPLIREPEAFSPNWVAHPRLDRFSGPELFIGQGGTTFGNVHRDHAGVHIGFVQLEGEKEFLLFPPDDLPYLYVFAGRQFPYEPRNSSLRYGNLDDIAQFPLLRHAHPQRLTLRAGEAMLLPSDWWHTTRNISDSVSYSIRIINSSNIARAAWRQIEGIPRWFARQ